MVERRGPALRQGPENAPMMPSQPGLVRLQKAIAILAHDIGHLVGWPRHRLCNRRDLYAVSGPVIVIASKGLATPYKCRCDKCR